MSRSNRCASAGLWLAPIMTIALLVAGCAHSGVTIQRDGRRPVKVGDDTALLPKEIVEFAISPMDSLRIEVTSAKSIDEPFKLETENVVRITFAYGQGEYRLLQGDEIRINFVADPQRDFEVIIRPDGRITLPRVREIVAQGKTPQTLAADIAKAHESLMKDPKTTVSVVRSNTALIGDLVGSYTIRPDGKISIPTLGEFVSAGRQPSELAVTLSEAASVRFRNKIEAFVVVQSFLTRSDLSLDRTVTVAPDGSMMLPEVGIVQAAGMTLPELHNHITKMLQRHHPNPLDVSLTLVAAASRTFYVAGQVQAPGPYPLASRMTMLKAIMTAGGLTDDGDLSKVVLMHHESDGSLTVYRTNLAEVLEKSKAEQDLVLSPQDAIFVPKSGIAQANQFVEQYINRMLPFVRSVNYNYNKNPDLSQ